MRERTVKVSEDEYQRIIQARQMLAQNGYSNLPLPQEQKQANDFTQGAVVGLGIAALIYLLSKEHD